MKRNKYISYVMMAAAVLAASSCTDFDDYNDVPTGNGSETALSGQTLWENIKQNGELSDFAAMVERTGYSKYLEEPNAFTVWAPVNGKYDKAIFEQMSDSMLLARFVKNHIAKFTYNASGEVNERVLMANGKSYDFTGNGSYTFGEVPLLADAGKSFVSQPCSNGALNLLDGYLPFYPNVYEYLSSRAGTDSVAAYFHRFEQIYLDRDNSVKGPMVNGKQTYVDSVMITYNPLINSLRAYINREDSSYTFLYPTNNAYTKIYQRIRDCYKYIAQTKAQDVEHLTSSGKATTTGDSERNNVYVQSDEINPAYMSDSIARLNMISHLIYNNNDSLNRWVRNRKAVEGDTLYSTRKEKFSNPAELFEQYLVGEPEKMSNGYVRVVDSLAFLPWELYNPELTYSTRWIGRDFSARTQPITVPDTTAQRILGPEATEFSFNLYTPKDADFDVPTVFFKLPEVRSTTYNFYCVVLPSELGQEAANPKPNKLNFNLSYCQAGTGNLANYHFNRKLIDDTGKALLPNPAEADVDPDDLSTMDTAFENDPTKADTLFIGQFTFPLCYAYLGSNYYPSLMITQPLKEKNFKNYSREIRIKSIILRPVEKDEYEAKNK